MSDITYAHNVPLQTWHVLPLYRLNHWLSADKPEQLVAGLNNSENVITAWKGDDLIGLGNAISDGHLVVYYPHLLVRPLYHKQGIGREIMRQLMAFYEGFHQHVMIAQNPAIDFYTKLGFTRAEGTESMWIYHQETSIACWNILCACSP